MNETDKPINTHGFPIREDEVSASSDIIKIVLNDQPIDLAKVGVGIDLFCGHGWWVAGQLGAFTNAHIHAVDYYNDVLQPFLSNNPRVTFHQGLVVDVLKANILPKADMVTLAFARDRHGFTPSNIYLLHDIVGSYLFTAGGQIDNPLPYTDYFGHVFTFVKQYSDYTALWKPK